VLRPEVTKSGCAACPSTSTSSSRVLEYVEERRKIGVRSERRLCEEVHLNLAYRWFCQLGRKLAKLIPIPALQPA
jgi:transposase